MSSSQTVLSSRRAPAKQPPPLVFYSPRCNETHNENPTQSAQEDPLKLDNPDDRWKHMSQLAGSHQQEATVLDLSQRILSPPALRGGVPPQVASRVRTLHLSISYVDGSLPEWLDVIVPFFSQLQHLYLSSFTSEETASSACRSREDETTTSSSSTKMRRLYVLYRLPLLESLDGIPVTDLERELARPSSPSGHRVDRNDWIATTTATSSTCQDEKGEPQHQQQEEEVTTSDEEEASEQQRVHGDAVEVGLYGVVKLVRTHSIPWNDDDEASTAASSESSLQPQSPQQQSPLEPEPKFLSNSSQTRNGGSERTTRTMPLERAAHTLLSTYKGSGVEPSALSTMSETSTDVASTIVKIDVGTDGEALQEVQTKDALQKSQRKKLTVDTSLAAATATTSQSCVQLFRTRCLSAPFPLLHKRESQGEGDLVPSSTEEKVSIQSSAVSSESPLSPQQSQALSDEPPTTDVSGVQSSAVSTKLSSSLPQSPTLSDEPLSPPSTSRSLSSPFPLQFRSKTFNGTYPFNSTTLEEKGHRRSVSAGSDDIGILAKATISSSALRDEKLHNVTSPTTTPQLKSLRKSLSKGELPPPCPGSSRRAVALSSPNIQKSKRSSRWRDKSKIRATSIVDDDEDSISEEEEDELQHK